MQHTCAAFVQGSQDGGAAESAGTGADPVSADKEGLAPDGCRQEGVTPRDPSFSRPAPCLLPEHHQARPRSVQWSCRTVHLQMSCTVYIVTFGVHWQARTLMQWLHSSTLDICTVLQYNLMSIWWGNHVEVTSSNHLHCAYTACCHSLEMSSTSPKHKHPLGKIGWAQNMHGHVHPSVLDSSV